MSSRVWLILRGLFIVVVVIIVGMAILGALFGESAKVSKEEKVVQEYGK